MRDLQLVRPTFFAGVPRVYEKLYMVSLSQARLRLLLSCQMHPALKPAWLESLGLHTSMGYHEV